MQTSQRGIELLKQFEGLRLNAYRDSAGVLTIGYGSTTDVEPGDSITPEGAERLLREDLKNAERAVEQLVTVPLNANQHAALVSFVFNLGFGNLASSTLLKRLNAGDYQGAQQEFGRWIYANGKVMAGLERRRNAEAQLFGDEPSDPDWYSAAIKRSSA